MRLEKICGILKASFICFDPNVRLEIDIDSWKDLVPYITEIWVE